MFFRDFDLNVCMNQTVKFRFDYILNPNVFDLIMCIATLLTIFKSKKTVLWTFQSSFGVFQKLTKHCFLPEKVNFFVKFRSRERTICPCQG